MLEIKAVCWLTRDKTGSHTVTGWPFSLVVTGTDPHSVVSEAVQTSQLEKTTSSHLFLLLQGRCQGGVVNGVAGNASGVPPQTVWGLQQDGEGVGRDWDHRHIQRLSFRSCRK